MPPHDVHERWVPVATAPGGDPGRSLQPIYDVLLAAGIDAGFDPYRPGDASSPYPLPSAPSASSSRNRPETMRSR